MLSSVFFQRLQDLEDHIAKDLELLKEFEEALRYETNPRVKAAYRHDIGRQQESIALYRQEYDELWQESANHPSTRIQEVGNQLQQMDAKLNILLNSQVVIYEDLNQMRQALLSRYNDTEKVLISAVAQQLDEAQLVLTQRLLEAVETNEVPESQIKQMLAVLEERLPSLPSTQANVVEVIKDPELDAKHKLIVTLPLVPLLVNYEGELELGAGFNIKSAWEKLINKLRRE